MEQRMLPLLKTLYPIKRLPKWMVWNGGVAPELKHVRHRLKKKERSHLRLLASILTLQIQWMVQALCQNCLSLRIQVGKYPTVLMKMSLQMQCGVLGPCLTFPIRNQQASSQHIELLSSLATFFSEAAARKDLGAILSMIVNSGGRVEKREPTWGVKTDRRGHLLASLSLVCSQNFWTPP